MLSGRIRWIFLWFRVSVIHYPSVKGTFRQKGKVFFCMHSRLTPALEKIKEEWATTGGVNVSGGWDTNVGQKRTLCVDDKFPIGLKSSKRL